MNMAYLVSKPCRSACWFSSKQKDGKKN